jgi:spermidine/putrescine transport system permease protein
MQIYAMIRFGVTPEINAMATLVMLASFVMLFAAQRFNRGRLPGG